MIKQLHKSGLLLLLLLLAVAGITTWLRTRPDNAAPATAADTIKQIDFFLENFRIRQYDDEGRLHYTFKGAQMNHFQQDDRAEISSPDLVLNPREKGWTVQAYRAVTRGTAEEIRFLGNVRVEQADSVLIRTEALLLKPGTEYMETLEPVVITGNGSNIEAQSLRANLQTGKHTLTMVKGRYEP